MRKYSKPLNYGNVFTKYNIVAVDSVRHVEALPFFFFILLFPEYFPVLGRMQKDRLRIANGLLCGFSPFGKGLLSDSELFLGDNRTVAVDVLLDQVIEKATTLTNEHLQSASCTMIFVI